ncbi:MAG: DUF262 domain-containing protein [Candidatus Acidiferrales bacterium]
MKYDNKEMTINELVSSFNQHRINLIPPFQRNTVWTLKKRQKLITNMLSKKPIPAIFFYLDAEGQQFVYNILDGKQRLETIILFIGDQRQGLKINKVSEYFYGKPAVDNANFKIELDGKTQTFAQLEDEVVRVFREIRIPTIQISMEEEHTSLEELVSLFVDINSEGVPVTRFDVVKALLRRDDPLFAQSFDLIAVRQVRKKKSQYYKAKNSNFTYVMKKLNVVSRLADPNMRVDRMWERLTEIALFARSKKHRAPAEILKAFIKAPKNPENGRLTKDELRLLRATFDYLAIAYRRAPALTQSKFATDQPQFYTICTLLLSTDTMDRLKPEDFGKYLVDIRNVLDGDIVAPKELEQDVLDYGDASTKQTTHLVRRTKRHDTLVKLLGHAEAKNKQVV